MIYLIVVYLIIGMFLYYKKYESMNKASPNQWLLRVRKEYENMIVKYPLYNGRIEEFTQHLIAVELMISAIFWPFGVVSKLMDGE